MIEPNSPRLQVVNACPPGKPAIPTAASLELGAEDYAKKSYAELLIGKVERILLRLGK